MLSVHLSTPGSCGNIHRYVVEALSTCMHRTKQSYLLVKINYQKVEYGTTIHIEEKYVVYIIGIYFSMIFSFISRLYTVFCVLNLHVMNENDMQGSNLTFYLHSKYSRGINFKLPRIIPYYNLYFLCF